MQHSVARVEAYQHAKLHLDPSNRLATIHRQDRQRSDNIGRTVLQTVAQKWKYIAIWWTIFMCRNAHQ